MEPSKVMHMVAKSIASKTDLFWRNQLRGEKILEKKETKHTYDGFDALARGFTAEAYDLKDYANACNERGTSPVGFSALGAVIHKVGMLYDRVGSLTKTMQALFASVITLDERMKVIEEKMGEGNE